MNLLWINISNITYNHASRIYNSNNKCNIEKHGLSLGSSLTPQHNSTCLFSPHETFYAWIYRVGHNAYAFDIWYTQTVDQTIPGWKTKNILSTIEILVFVWKNMETSYCGMYMETLCGPSKSVTWNMVLLHDDHEFVWEIFQYPK